VTRLSGDEDYLERLREICLAHHEAEEVLPHHKRPLFRVRRRRFAIFNGETSPDRKRWAGWPRSLHFLADADERDALLADSRFRPSPHHPSSGWLAIELNDETDWTELCELIDAAYNRAAPRELRTPVGGFEGVESVTDREELVSGQEPQGDATGRTRGQ
jgi:predicted DNA-binding protein (MmcQ/YjbR family)